MFSVGTVKFCSIGDRVRLLPMHCRFKGVDPEARRVENATSVRFDMEEGLGLSGDAEYQVFADSNEGLFQITPLGHPDCRSICVQATWLESVHKFNVLTGRHSPFYVKPQAGDLVSIEPPSFLGVKAVQRHQRTQRHLMPPDGKDFELKRFKVETCSFTHMLFSVRGGSGSLFDVRSIWRLERDGCVLVDRRCTEKQPN